MQLYACCVRQWAQMTAPGFLYDTVLRGLQIGLPLLPPREPLVQALRKLITFSSGERYVGMPHGNEVN